MEPRANRPLRSYGRKKGHKLSPRQQRLFDDLLPTLRVDPAAPPPKAIEELFAHRPQAVALEIGFGAGEHLLWQAAANPTWGFIGCEPFLNGMASILGRIETDGLSNIRLHDGDARDLIDWLPPRSLARVFILFPDPWPKKRHAKRRLVTADLLKALSRLMIAGGELRFASDIPVYVADALLAAKASGAFDWRAVRAADWRERPDDWPPTRYEAKALAQGRRSCYLRFRYG